MNNKRSTKFIPLIISVSIIIGLLLGSFYANHFTGSRLSIINTSSNKINVLTDEAPYCCHYTVTAKSLATGCSQTKDVQVCVVKKPDVVSIQETMLSLSVC